MPLPRCESSFLFKTQLSLVETTGVKATDLAELSHSLKEVPESSVYYHTHHFLQQHQFLIPEPPNDFAYWTTQVLQEDRIGEKLAAIDTVRFTSLASLRDALVESLDRYLESKPPLRKAPDGEEFHFMRCTLFNLPTPYEAQDLRTFLECLKKVSIGSLYYHVFEGRLRPPLGTSDFANWLSTALNEKKLASRIDKMDPYTQTMEGLRNKIVSLVEQRLGELGRAEA